MLGLENSGGQCEALQREERGERKGMGWMQRAGVERERSYF